MVNNVPYLGTEPSLRNPKRFQLFKTIRLNTNIDIFVEKSLFFWGSESKSHFFSILTCKIN